VLIPDREGDKAGKIKKGPPQKRSPQKNRTIPIVFVRTRRGKKAGECQT